MSKGTKTTETWKCDEPGCERQHEYSCVQSLTPQGWSIVHWEEWVENVSTFSHPFSLRYRTLVLCHEHAQTRLASLRKAG